MSLYQEIQLPFSHTPLLYYDSVNAVSMATNLVFHSHTKYIKLNIHFIRDKVANGDLVI